MIWVKKSVIFLKRINSILILVLVSLSVNGQSNKQDLEREKNQIEAEIKYTNDLLNLATKNKNSSLQEIVLINNKINQRERLIVNYSSEIQNLEQVINSNNENIVSLQSELKEAKLEYARLINYIFKNKNPEDRLMYILAADNFSQAFQRLKYLQYYSEYRKNQAVRIVQISDSVISLNKRLDFQKQEKQDFLQKQQNEIKTLENDKDQQKAKVADLSKQEVQFRAEIRQKKNEAEKLNKAINDIISAEMKAAADNARKSGAEKLSDIIALTPAELELTNTFSQNKGKLPWPSEHGIISSTFGEHDHPVLKKVKIKNNGIDILTNPGEKARAVFNGKVISVRTITNTNQAVIIRHGEYFTVYSNLIEVDVKTGDEVKTKQSLGIVYTNQADSKTELHFEIWKGKTLLNPQYWVAK